MHDVKRGGIAYDTGGDAIELEGEGKQRVEFEMPLTILNNGEFKLVASLRTRSATDPDDTDMIAFTNDNNSCLFAVRDSTNREYALLNDTAMTIRCVQHSQC